MPSHRAFALDCAYIAWREARREELILSAERAPAPAPRILSFTFNDVSALAEERERRVVLKTSGGVTH